MRYDDGVDVIDTSRATPGFKVQPHDVDEEAKKGFVKVQGDLRESTYVRLDSDCCSRGAENPWKPKGRR